MFLIIARPRSGTTLLRTLFDRHPNVVIPIESPFILRYFWKYHKVKNWTKEKILEFYEDITDDSEPDYLTIERWTIDKEQLKKDLLALEGQTTYSELCKVVNASYQSLFPTEEVKVVGDKNPIYSNRSNYLLKLFPDAKVIHMTRDYRDYLQSMLRAGFVKNIEPIIMHRWKKSWELNTKLERKYPKQFLFVRYEDLVETPEKTFKKMCSFLEIPYTDNIFDFHKYKETALKYYSEEDLELYHSKLFKPINNKNVGDWKKNLTKEQVEVAEAIAGKVGEQAGYVRSLQRISLRTRIKIQPVLFYLWATKTVGNMLRMFPHNKNVRKFIERGPVLGKKYWDNVKEKS